MPLLELFSASAFWHLLTRLGEAQIALPSAAVTAAALMVRRDSRQLALRWLVFLACAITLTTLTKVAFIGWGVQSVSLDFTGISGHTMFSSAIYPVLMLVFMGGARRDNYRLPLALGYGLALLVGLSRLAVGAHSPSEVLAGWFVGGAASGLAIAAVNVRAHWNLPLVPLLLLAWISITPFQLPPSQSHSLVTRLALTLSGHNTPYRRMPHGPAVRDASFIG